MATPIFDRETWLDITVNVIPLGIIAFFLVLFLVASPWEIAGLMSLVSFGLLVVPFVGLAILTYFAAQFI